MRPGLRRDALAGLRVIRGGSMSPLLRDGDIVVAEPLAAGAGRVGDVVAFTVGGGGTVVVHRVVRVVDGGYVTRGDAVPHEDEGVVIGERVIGRIVAARRADRAFAVAGGRRGRVRGAVARLRAGGVRGAGRLAASCASLLPGGWAAGILPASARPRVVRFASAGSVERRVLIGRLVAGRYDEARAAWRVRVRFTPFVKPEGLPRG